MTKQKFMDGTATKESYLVVGENEQIRVGVRNLFSIGPVGVDLRIRVRVAQAEGFDGDVSEIVEEMLPRARFGRGSEERVSIVTGIVFETLSPSLLDEENVLKMFEDNIAKTVLETVFGLPNFEWRHTEAEVADYLREKLKKLFIETSEEFLKPEKNIMQTSDHDYGDTELHINEKAS
jgi:hypothetical protein